MAAGAGPPPETRHAQPHQDAAVGPHLDDLLALLLVFADGGVGDPDIAAASTCKPCGVANRLAPMLCTALPVFTSMMCTAARDEPSQLVPAQRSIAQISPLGPISMPALVPQGVPSGSYGPAALRRLIGIGQLGKSRCDAQDRECGRQRDFQRDFHCCFSPWRGRCQRTASE